MREYHIIPDNIDPRLDGSAHKLTHECQCDPRLCKDADGYVIWQHHQDNLSTPFIGDDLAGGPGWKLWSIEVK